MLGKIGIPTVLNTQKMMKLHLPYSAKTVSTKRIETSTSPIHFFLEKAQEIGIQYISDTDIIQAYSTPYNYPMQRIGHGLFRPSSESELQSLIKLAAHYPVDLIMQGGRTSLVEGSTPTRGSAVPFLVQTNFKKHHFDPTKKWLKVGADLTLLEAQEIAKSLGLRLAVNYGSKGSATVGGGIATGAMGMECGIPSILREVHIIDGNGDKHHFSYPNGCPSGSLFPGSGEYWPIASQGLLGVITDASLQLTHAEVNNVSCWLAFDSYMDMVNMVLKMDDDLSTDYVFQHAELIYHDALKKVGSPFSAPHPYSLLISYASHLPDYDLVSLVLEKVMPFESTFKDSLLSQNNSEFIDKREDISDASRQHAHLNGLSVLSFDLSCDIPYLPRLLKQLDYAMHAYSWVKEFNVFGHLKQDKVKSTIHYNLALSLSKIPEEARSQKETVEHTILDILYSSEGKRHHCTHSGEHGGLGQKNIQNTCQYASESERKQLKAQIESYNPNHVLGKNKIESIYSVLDLLN